MLSNNLTRSLQVLVGSVLPLTAGLGADSSFEELSTTQLEARRTYIDSELENLADYSLRRGLGSKGFRSFRYASSQRTEWIKIDLGRLTRIDQVALVPSILHDARVGYVNDAFPRSFRIIAGNSQTGQETEIARYEKLDTLSSRIAPFVANVPPTLADWVKIEAFELSPRVYDDHYVLQLAEIFVFSGERNVALRRPVEASSSHKKLSRGWDTAFAVDGFVPYQMDAKQERENLGFLGNASGQAHITFDLGAAHDLYEIRLHPVGPGIVVPLHSIGDEALPESLIIEIANREDFSDAQTAYEYYRKSFNDLGPLICLPIEEVTGRFVRLRMPHPDHPTQETRTIGFSEIEIISTKGNVAQGTLPTSNITPIFQQSPRNIPSYLTDGLNFFGELRTPRAWINELSRRHELETERPLLIAELNRRYSQQKTNLVLLQRVSIGLIVVIIILILVSRNLRLRELQRTKEQLAADLHDELGANLHSIGLLSDLAEESKNDPEELANLHQHIRAATERSGIAVRHCINMLEADGMLSDTTASMQRAANRIISRLKHTVSIQGEEFLRRLTPKRRFDFFLFYKECLINTARHSQATSLRTELVADSKRIRLTVTDNGEGIPNENNDIPPKSLRRRARLLNGKVSLQRQESGGTSIILNLRINKWWFSG